MLLRTRHAPRVWELAICLLLIAPVARGSALQRPSGEPAPAITRILFVGNSYTYFNDLPAIVETLARDGGHAIETRMVAPGGWRLKDHFEKGEARGVLHEGHWDFVVLQEQSTLGANVSIDGLPRVASDAVFRPWAEAWAREVAAAGAKPVFYLTWARKKSPEDQAFLTGAVRSAASATRSEVAPVGPAWALARERRPSLELYIDDGSHPSPAGSYLAACTLYATLFRASPVGLSSRASGAPVDPSTEELVPGETAVLVDLAAEDARALQEAAWDAFHDFAGEHGAQERPARLELPPLPDGAPLTEMSLAGSWTGPFAFSPTGPASLMLYFDPPSADAGWSGHVEIEFHSKDVPDVSADLADLRVAGGRLSFSVPKALLGLDVQFVAVLLSRDELTGHAEAGREDEDGGTRLLGSWTLHLKD